MKLPRNPKMPIDDRSFHDEGIKNRRWFEKTPLAEWLNTLATELHNVFKRFGREFNDSKSDQLADLLDNIQPVGTVVWAAMSPEQFTANKWGRWALADGSAAPRDSKFFMRGLGYQQNGSTERFLPDCRKYVRVPSSQNDLSVNRGTLGDTVSVSGITVSDGNVSGKVSTDCNFGTRNVTGTDVTLTMRQMSSFSGTQPLIYNPDADQSANAHHGGGHIISRGYVENTAYAQNFIKANTHAHSITLNHTFTGNILAGSKASGMRLGSSASETRPKTQLLNAFVRVD